MKTSISTEGASLLRLQTKSYILISRELSIHGGEALSHALSSVEDTIVQLCEQYLSCDSWARTKETLSSIGASLPDEFYEGLLEGDDDDPLEFEEVWKED